MEILTLLKQLAIDPFRFRKEPKVRKSILHQVLKIREVMLATNSTAPQRKRKHPQLTKPNINDDDGFASKKFDDRTSKKVKGYNDDFTPVSCTHELEAQTAKVLVDCTTPDSAGLLTLEDKSIQNLGNIHSSSSTSLSVHGSSHRSLGVPCLDEVPSCKEDRTETDLQSMYKDTKQLPIPVGPYFQVHVPEWTDTQLYNIDNAKDLRWLGTRVWPMEGETVESSIKDVGKGRNENCSCPFPGSSDCVNQHVLEERLKLQSELGLAFQRWRINEMGEAVTESWTTREHKAFNSLVKKSMLRNGVDFWKHASKCFPGKSDKDLTHYFLNVFIPRCIGLQTRLSRKSIDTDGDVDDEDVDDLNIRKKSKAESSGVKKSKYLRGR
ncbi:unnamed protein product [Rhodiola kirilowii]